MQIEVKKFVEIDQYLKDMPETMFDDAKPLFQKAVIDADKRVKRLFGIRIQSRTGNLRRSLRTSVKGMSLDSLQASFYSAANVAGTPIVHAPIQEFGGTINAIDKYKKVPGGPYLNVPTEANQTAAGVMRKTARMVFNKGGYIQKTKKGRWGVFLGNKMMFALVKRVHVTPKLSMRSSAERQVSRLLSSLSKIIGND